MNEPMDDEADAWFYDLGELATVVERNDLRQRRTTRRLMVLGGFVLFAFLLLAWSSEINADRISAAQARVSATQDAACLSGLEILRKSNLLQDALIEIERTNEFAGDEVRAARIEAYESARINPLPVCSTR